MNTLTRPEPTRERIAVAVPLVIALTLSVFAHGTAAFVALLLHGGSGAHAGESGVRGAGDTTIDISVAGPAASMMVPPSRAADPTPPAPSSDHVITPPLPPPTASAEATQPPPPPLAHQERDQVHQPDPPPATGTGAETTSGGRAAGLTDVMNGVIGGAPNTIEGQRALLPSAMACADPVAGRWEALKYNPIWGDWVHFTLVIHATGGALVGTITSRTWSGSPSDSSPPPCGDNSFDIVVQMNGHGHSDSPTRIEFGASSYTITSTRCTTSTLSYSPDRFSGTIDARRQEFQSVNNDGSRDIDAPYVFRRTGCSDP